MKILTVKRSGLPLPSGFILESVFLPINGQKSANAISDLIIQEALNHQSKIVVISCYSNVTMNVSLAQTVAKNLLDICQVVVLVQGLQIEQFAGEIIKVPSNITTRDLQSLCAISHFEKISPWG